MDKETLDRITAQVPLIKKFLQLHPDEQEWLYPLLGQKERRIVDILQIIEGRFLTYEQIADAVNCHPSTVKQTLYALSAGGIQLNQDKTGRWSTLKGGRYRTLNKIGESKE